MSSVQATNAPGSQDPYVEKATNNDLTAQQKIDGLKEILAASNCRYGMLTTHCPDGQLHSRAMALASHDSLHFSFFTNTASHKVDELSTDSHVNLSFLDPSTTNWVSISGFAKVTRDQEEINRLWNHSVAAYFDNKHDGTHTGDQNDPRVGIIEISPEEIQYWYVTKGKVARTLETAKGAVTGNTAAPGELRTISKQEIQLVESLHHKA